MRTHCPIRCLPISKWAVLRFSATRTAGLSREGAWLTLGAQMSEPTAEFSMSVDGRWLSDQYVLFSSLLES